MNNAGSIPRERFSAMTRLDHNRAKAQIAAKTGVQVASVTNMTIWGNHSATQFPDLYNAKVDGKRASDLVEQDWIEGEFIPKVQLRGAAVIEARGASSAASAASAALDHMRDWSLGTAKGDWASMAVCSDGSYGVPEGLISGFPCTTKEGEWKIVQGLDVNDFSRGRIDASVGELGEERAAVADLGLI
jgi:malate dehydrogenase